MVALRGGVRGFTGADELFPEGHVHALWVGRAADGGSLLEELVVAEWHDGALRLFEEPKDTVRLAFVDDFSLAQEWAKVKVSGAL